MAHLSDTVHKLILSTLDLSAMLINVLYIFIIRQKTTKALVAYSALLLNIACVDFVSSLCSFMSMASIKHINGTVVIRHIGPCTLLNERWSGHCDCVAQSVLLSVCSFAYRLWMLKTPVNVQKQQRRIWTIARMTILAIGILNTSAHFFGGAYPIVYLDGSISALALAGGVTDNFISRISVVLVILIYYFGFTPIFFLRRKLFEEIGKLKPCDRHNHRQIYRSLTVQVMLPLAYILGSNLWFLDDMGIVNSPTLQQSIIELSSLFSLISPLINLYYIPPYRKCDVITIEVKSN